MTVPNADFALHDGVTADLRVKSRTVQAMRVSPAILSLNDEGKIGVKIVETNVARFVPVTLIDDSPDGVYIARKRHVQALQRCAAHLASAQTHAEQADAALDLFAEDLRLAHDALAEITGVFTSDDLLGEIFGHFCIGK